MSKDIILVHVGGSYSAIQEIGKQASKDLGLKIEMQAVDGSAQMNRMMTQPKTIDINDIASYQVPYLLGRNIVQAVPLSKYKWWDKTVPLFTKGEYPGGRPTSMQGIAPIMVQYYQSADAKKLSTQPTEWLTGVPTIYNADTLGIRPDLVGEPISSWQQLLDPRFKGRSALVDDPSVGVMDVAMALEASGRMKYINKGNMTRQEIDKTIEIMMEVKRSGQFRSFWTRPCGRI